MTVLGVDPGTLSTGFGVIGCSDGAVYYIASGSVKNSGGDSIPDRLSKIYERIADVIRTYRPDEFAIESAFYGKNAQSALKLGQARGVAMLAAVQTDIAIAEYSPREVKRALVGNGAASKKQVGYMVRKLLRIESGSMLHDASDALAVAICHIHRALRPEHEPAYRDWKSYLEAHPERIVR